MMQILESETLLAEFHARGAALHRLVYKPLGRGIIMPCASRHAPHHYCNTVVGPIANRIAGARFAIDGEKFMLDANEGGNTLHGGDRGLSEMEWDVQSATAGMIHFTIALPDLHMGFPGPARFDALYYLKGAELHAEYRATSPRKNVFNLAPHFYFNLDGGDDFDNHVLQIAAAHYLPVDDANIPTGKVAPVAGTDFDFREGKSLGDITIDHNFCLDGYDRQKTMRKVARLTAGGIAMRLAGDCAGLQVYDCRHAGRSHIALEPQGWPNAVNAPSFPQTITAANATWRTKTVFAFGAD